MAATRVRQRRGSSLVRTVARLVFLVGLGFGLGLVIGLATEEPQLVYGYLTGQGETVVLADSEAELPILARGDRTLEERAPRDAGAFAMPRAERIAAVDSEGRRLAASESGAASGTSAKLPNVAARPPQGTRATQGATRASDGASKSWAIQVGAFADEKAARRLEADLENKDYPVAVLPADGGKQSWRVRIQPLRGEGKARELANRLKQKEGLPTWLIPLDASSR